MNNMAAVVELEVGQGARLTPRDHFEGLREQRRDHMRKALWWKNRYRAWGGSMELQWFLAEARSHRFVSRTLWKYGTN